MPRGSGCTTYASDMPLSVEPKTRTTSSFSGETTVTQRSAPAARIACSASWPMGLGSSEASSRSKSSGKSSFAYPLAPKRTPRPAAGKNPIGARDAVTPRASQLERAASSARDRVEWPLVDVFLKFRYEERDLLDVVRLRTRAIERAALAIGLIAILMAAYQVVSRGAVRTLVWAVAVPAVVLASLLVGTLAIVPRVLLRRRDMRAQRSLDASDEGVTITIGERHETIRWPDVSRVDRGARVYALYWADQMLLVPRRAFRGPDREKAFSDLLERFVSARQREDGDAAAGEKQKDGDQHDG